MIYGIKAGITLHSLLNGSISTTSVRIGQKRFILGRVGGLYNLERLRSNESRNHKTKICSLKKYFELCIQK